MSSVEELGDQAWTKLVNRFPGRTDLMLRIRWQKLSADNIVNKRHQVLPRQHKRSSCFTSIVIIRLTL
jgi:hypothetical protein